MARIYAGSALGLLCKSLPSPILKGYSSGPREFCEMIWLKLNLCYRYIIITNIRLFQLRTKHGLSLRKLKMNYKSKYLDFVENTQTENLGYSNSPAPGLVLPKSTKDLRTSSALKCNLIAAFIGVIPGKPSLWQIVTEFKYHNREDGSKYRDLVVFETTENYLSNWRILKFM